MLFEDGVAMVICYLPERSNWTIFFHNWFMNKSHLFLSGFKLLTLLFYAKLFMLNCFAISDSIHSFHWWLVPLFFFFFFLAQKLKEKKYITFFLLLLFFIIIIFFLRFSIMGSYKAERRADNQW